MTEGGRPPTQRRLSWISRDAWIIISARGLRTFAQASVTVLIAVYLDLLGFSLVQIGLFISLGLAGGAFFATIVAFFGNAFGRRRLLTVFTLLMGGAGVALAFTDQFLLLAIVVFVSSLNMANSGGGPVQPLEQATLPGTTDPGRRTDLFAVYNIVSTASRAVGALGAGLPTLFQHVLGMEELTSFRVMFGAFAVISVVGALLYALLSPAVEVAAIRRRWTNPFALPSRRRIFLLAALFSTDTFGTRLVAQALVSYWFVTRFGVELAAVGFLFFLTEALHSLSMWLAAKLANRFGLLNTIVFSHIPAVVLIAVLPFMPTATLAAAVWLARGFFSQMDGPTRQSYIMGVVSSEERTAMAGFANMGQNVTGSASPSVAALLWSSIWMGAPFVATAVVKSVYLIGFYTLFRNVRPPEEQTDFRSEAPPARGGVGHF